MPTKVFYSIVDDSLILVEWNWVGSAGEKWFRIQYDSETKYVGFFFSRSVSFLRNRNYRYLGVL